MIVKIQRPLEPFGADRPKDYNPADDIAMVYNQSRIYVAHVLMRDVMHLFKDGELKVYCKARASKGEGIATINMDKMTNLRISIQDGRTTEDILAAGTLVLDKRVADQPW